MQYIHSDTLLLSNTNSRLYVINWVSSSTYCGWCNALYLLHNGRKLGGSPCDRTCVIPLSI